MKKITVQILIALIGYLSACLALAAQAESVGKVIITNGEVYALDQNQHKRMLKRGAEVFINETLVTGPKSLVQFRYTDNTIVSLQADSKYAIDAYRYQKHDSQANKHLVNLAQGSIREISGLLNKGNPDAYKITTPVATIGVRGTSFLLGTRNKQTVAGVFEGAVQVSTAAETKTIGPEFDNSLALVDSVGGITLYNDFSALPDNLANNLTSSGPTQQQASSTDEEGAVSDDQDDSVDQDEEDDSMDSSADDESMDDMGFDNMDDLDLDLESDVALDDLDEWLDEEEDEDSP